MYKVKMRCFLLLLLEAFTEVFGQGCTTDFSQDICLINRGNTTIPEGTVVLAPFLTFKCNGHITHVSVRFEVIDMSSNETVYLQLRRKVEGMEYYLITEVMLPKGEPEGNHSILCDYELPDRMKIQENDVIGFRTPEDSSVAVLVETTNMTINRQLLFSSTNSTDDIFDSVMIEGLPQISVGAGTVHYKYCKMLVSKF